VLACRVPSKPMTVSQTASSSDDTSDTGEESNSDNDDSDVVDMSPPTLDKNVDADGDQVHSCGVTCRHMCSSHAAQPVIFQLRKSFKF